jgi:hypothetical protein
MVRKQAEVAEQLNAHPDEKHWEAFRKFMLKGGAKYYKVFYPRKLRSGKDMLSAYAMIYDSRYVPMFRVPIVVKVGGKVRGATIYLKELLNTNRDYKEWIS